MNTTILVIAGVFGVLFIGVSLWLSQSAQKKKKSNLETLIAKRGAQNASYDDGDKPDTQKPADTPQDIAKKLKNMGDDIPDQGLSPKSIRYMLIQAGLNTPIYRYWIWSIISCIGCFLMAKTFGWSNLVVGLVTFTGLFGLPRFILKKKVSRRQSKFLEDFADCLEGMIRLLKSGMPISEAIAMTSREYEGPIGEEMTKVYEDQRVGDTLPDAVQKMAFRVPIPEVKMFATAVTIQAQTGSSLSEVLENLSNVIRQRFRLKRKVEALSAEAKISAGIIGALPLVVIGAMYLLNPEYISQLWTTSTGKMLMYGSITWMGIGMFIMKQMINFRV